MKNLLSILKPFGPLAEPRDLRYYLGAAFCGLLIIATLFWLWGCGPLPTAPSAPRGCYVLTDTLGGVSTSNLVYYHVNDSLGCPQGLLP